MSLVHLLLNELASKLLVVDQNFLGDLDPALLPAAEELGRLLLFELKLLSEKLGKSDSLLEHGVLVVLGLLGTDGAFELVLGVAEVHEVLGVGALEDCGLRVEFDRVSFLVHFNYGRINQGGVQGAEDRSARECHLDQYGQEFGGEAGV